MQEARGHPTYGVGHCPTQLHGRSTASNAVSRGVEPRLPPRRGGGLPLTYETSVRIFSPGPCGPTAPARYLTSGSSVGGVGIEPTSERCPRRPGHRSPDSFPVRATPTHPAPAGTAGTESLTHTSEPVPHSVTRVGRGGENRNGRDRHVTPDILLRPGRRANPPRPVGGRAGRANLGYQARVLAPGGRELRSPQGRLRPRSRGTSRRSFH